MGGEISAAVRRGEHEERREKEEERDGGIPSALLQQKGRGAETVAAAGLPTLPAAAGDTTFKQQQHAAAAAYDASTAEREKSGRRKGKRKKRRPSEQPPRGLQVVSRLVWGNVHDCYRISWEILGRGSSGPLYSCTSKISCRNFCIRFFNKKKNSISAVAAAGTSSSPAVDSAAAAAGDSAAAAGDSAADAGDSAAAAAMDSAAAASLTPRHGSSSSSRQQKTSPSRMSAAARMRLAAAAERQRRSSGTTATAVPHSGASLSSPLLLLPRDAAASSSIPAPPVASPLHLPAAAAATPHFSSLHPSSPHALPLSAAAAAEPATAAAGEATAAAAPTAAERHTAAPAERHATAERHAAAAAERHAAAAAERHAAAAAAERHAAAAERHAAAAAACKKPSLTKEQLARARIKNEISVSVRVDHPNIARLIEVFEDENQLFMVTEYCSGGDLYTHLRRCGRFSEQQARPVVAQMLLALSYLHAHDIVHRDLRLEKWTFATAAAAAGRLLPSPSSFSSSSFSFSSSSIGTLKLIDLGHAKHWVNKAKKMNAACGSLPYASPDILVGGYTEACDLWSLGVIVYMLLCGRPPFHGTADEMIDQILSGRYSTTSPEWENVSPAAIDFVRRLLDVDPERRMTAQEARCHFWVALPRVKDVPLPANFLLALRNFAACTKVKRTILTMVAYSVTDEGAAGFDKLFLELSNAAVGTIPFADFSSLLRRHYPSLDVAEVGELFDAMDSTQSGEIHYNDFLAAMLRVSLAKEEALLIHTFRKCDVDRSGYISLNDLNVILGDQYTPEALEQVMRNFDTNGNGRIDLEEFLEAIRQDEEYDSFSTDASVCPTLVAASSRRYF